jgi:hypothetical protein
MRRQRHIERSLLVAAILFVAHPQPANSLGVCGGLGGGLGLARSFVSASNYKDISHSGISLYFDIGLEPTSNWTIATVFNHWTPALGSSSALTANFLGGIVRRELGRSFFGCAGAGFFSFEGNASQTGEERTWSGLDTGVGLTFGVGTRIANGRIEPRLTWITASLKWSSSESFRLHLFQLLLVFRLD